MAKTAKKTKAAKVTRAAAKTARRVGAAKTTSARGQVAKAGKVAASAMPATARKARKIKRREWTRDDVRQLRSLAKQRTPVARIAKMLKRTPGATAAKAFKLGVSLDTRR